MGLIMAPKRRAGGRSVDQHGCMVLVFQSTILLQSWPQHLKLTYLYSTERYRIQAGSLTYGSIALPALHRLLDFCHLGLKRSSRSTWGGLLIPAHINILLCCSLFYAAFVEFSLGIVDRAATENEPNLGDL